MRLTAKRKDSKGKSENRRWDWNSKQGLMKRGWEKIKSVNVVTTYLRLLSLAPAGVNGFSLQH